jgi:hypothetical protein
MGKKPGTATCLEQPGARSWADRSWEKLVMANERDETVLMSALFTGLSPAEKQRTVELLNRPDLDKDSPDRPKRQGGIPPRRPRRAA